MLTIAKKYPNKWTRYQCTRQTLPIDLLDDCGQNIIPQKESNTLLLNSDSKTKEQNTEYSKYQQLKFADTEIERVTNIKFLGVILTETLNWYDHMLYVCSKMNKSIGYFYKARAVLDQAQLLNLYTSFIEPYIVYCLPVWGGYINRDSTNNQNY